MAGRAIAVGGIAAVTVLATLLAAGCTTSGDGDGADVSATAATPSSSASGAPASAAGPAPSGSPAELSLRLESLLGQHNVLAADMMRARLRGDPDLVQAANAALGKNTEAMGQLIGAMFGAAASKQFTPMWSQHITFLFNYARGLADHDNAVRDQAHSGINAYEHQLAAFFSGASQGRLPQSVADAAVKMHVDHLLQQADAYAAKDYQRAEDLYREGYAHTFGLGNALASTLLPPAVAAALKVPSWQLRSELARLLGEHVVLVIGASRAAVLNGADFDATARALDANTRDLAGAVDTLFGAKAASDFQRIWADHVDALMAYSAGVVARDTARQADAEQKLSGFEEQLSGFLAGATGNRVSSTALSDAFREHDEMLLRDVDAFAAKKYQEAHDSAYTMYQEMFDLAAKLSSAIGATVAARLPRGAAQTGRGGMAAGG